MPIENYAFAMTTKIDGDTYVEDRGYPVYRARGSQEFATIDAVLGEVLQPGQTATKTEGGWVIEDRFPLLEDAKARKLVLLHNEWLQAEANGTVTMDGVPYDCNDRANRDIAGLIVSMESSGEATVLFCAHDNSFHELSLADLKDLQLLVIGRAQALYARKWELRTALVQATSLEAVQAIQISFEGV